MNEPSTNNQIDLVELYWMIQGIRRRDCKSDTAEAADKQGSVNKRSVRQDKRGSRSR